MPHLDVRVLARLRLRPKLTIAFLALSLLIGVCGASGLLFVNRIGATVAEFSDVTSPMLGRTVQLADNTQRLRAAFAEAMNGAADEKSTKALAELEGVA